MEGLGWLETEMVRAFDTALAPVGIGVAAVAGAAHALRPGHGKTLAAAYLIGGQSRRRHAVALAAMVAAMHTASVLLLGVAWWFTAGGTATPIETATRWGQLLVAGIVVGIGAVIFRNRWRAFRQTRVPVTAGTGPGHHHHRALSHGPPPGVAPWSRAGLAGIASVGALVPSPTAFLVLISGLLTGRTLLAVGMVAAFGLGLAATVLATGMAVLAGRDWLAERSLRYPALGRASRHLPLLGATAVLAGGCVLSVSAVATALAP